MSSDSTDTHSLTVQLTQIAPPWAVVVFDDPVNLMEYVTKVLMRIFLYPEARARKLMLEIHELGKSTVWVGDKEKAEFYVQQLHAHQLQATLEPVDA